MAQLQKGTTYTGTGVSSFVTHTNLNAHVDNARLVGGAIDEQVQNSVTTDNDLLLINKGGELFKQTKGQFTHTINSNTINAETLNVTNLVTNSVVPVGSIIMWSGTQEQFLSLPSNWKLCDGQNGTPDLRNKFIIGAGGEHAVGDTGGSNEVTIVAENLPEHDHEFRIRQADYVEIFGSSVITVWDVAPNANDTGYTQKRTTLKSGFSNPTPIEITPTFYALAYIMRIS